MAIDALPDSAADVMTYLQRRKCGRCREPLDGVTTAAVCRSRYSPKFRCPFPHPTCWEFACPGCAAPIVVCVRKGKVWPLYASEITRRSPHRPQPPAG